MILKTCGKSEFDIFEAKKRFPDSKKACVLKRKVAKMRFLPENDLFWGKNVRERKSVVFRPKYVIFSNFRVDIQLFLNPRNFINAKFGFHVCFYVVFRQKSHFC